MKSKTRFNNDSSELRRHSIKVNLTNDERNINEINYYYEHGVMEASYEIRPWHVEITDYPMKDEDIINAGVFLLRAGKFQEFYSLYLLIKNDKIKSLLRESLDKISKEYSVIELESKPNISLKDNILLSFAYGHFFLSTMADDIHKNKYEISLDGKSKIISCSSKKVSEISDENPIYIYKRDITDTNYVESGVVSPLNDIIVHDHSYYICQSDIEEYLRLISSLSKEDQYYDMVLQAGKNYKGNIKSLGLKINGNN